MEEQLVSCAQFYNGSPDTLYFGPHVEGGKRAYLFMFCSPGLPDGRAIYDRDFGW